jgi:carboxymethylenebutenolidase
VTASTSPNLPFTTERRSFVVDGESVALYVARPATPTAPTAPAEATVILLGAIWSVTRHIEEICDRLAAAGIAAIAPCLFRGRGIPPLDADADALARTFLAFDDRRCTRDLKQLVALAARGGLGFDAGALVPWGFCLGGRFAHNLAAVTTEVAGVVNFYGRVRFARQAIKPFLPIELAGLIQVPYLGHFAETDALIPAQDVADLKAALAEHGVAHEIHVYPGTRHAFFDSTRPADHDAQASAMAWARSLAFVNEVARRRKAARSLEHGREHGQEQA